MDMIKLVAVLMSWGVQLTDYPAPQQPPALEYRPHSFFVENACSNHECAAMGWYNDQDVIYIDESLRGKDSVFIRSLIFHEIVHYLQHKSGEFDTYSCEDQVWREREAYSLQRGYVAQVHGEAMFPRPHAFSCYKRPE